MVPPVAPVIARLAVVVVLTVGFASVACDSDEQPGATATTQPHGTPVAAVVEDSGLYVMKPDGSDLRRIAGDDDHFYFGPAWSPDSTTIIVSRYMIGERGEFFLVEPDGSNLRPFSSGGLPGYLPTWSADGEMLAFVSQEGDDVTTADVHTFAADSAEESPVTDDDVQDYGAAWSADGKTLFIGSNTAAGWQILQVDLATLSASPLATPAAGNAPALSSDGNLIAFTSDRDGDDDIYVMDVDGGNQRNLTANDTHDDNPSWSPDGSRIVYDCDAICVLDLATGEVAVLTSGVSRPSTPAWSPDGSMIAFVAVRPML
jgi:Tol biopolymer transport system component